MFFYFTRKLLDPLSKDPFDSLESNVLLTRVVDRFSCHVNIKRGSLVRLCKQSYEQRGVKVSCYHLESSTL